MTMSGAFIAPAGAGLSTFAGGRRPARARGPRMSAAGAAAADVYIAAAATRAAKTGGAPGGVYSAQCTEGGARGAAEAARVAVLSRAFRLRQAGPSARFADLFATRRVALAGACGAHFAEASAVAFPAAAGARALGAREAALACARYFPDSGPAAELMHAAVVRQYAAVNGVPGGVYSTACADGSSKGMAEDARVAALGVQFRAGMLPPGEAAAARYNAARWAIAEARGCDYEEQMFVAYPKMAAAVKGLATGAYAASVGGASAPAGAALAPAPLAERLAGENAAAIWPSSDIRKAVDRYRKPWEKSLVPDYSYMSAAAVAYGVASHKEPFVEDKYDPDRWVPGWQPRSKLQKTYGQ